MFARVRAPADYRHWVKASLAAGGMLFLLAGSSGCGRQETTDNAPLDVQGDLIVSERAMTNNEAPASQAVELSETSIVAEDEKVPASTDSDLHRTSEAVSKAAGYVQVGFDLLAGYDFEISDQLLTNALEDISEANDQIPKQVKALDSKQVALKGFMLPLKVEGGLVTELLIMRDQSMCCYGVVPKINEWVSVKMTDTGVKPIMDQPVTFFGTLHVGAMRENGYLVGLYAMDAEKMAGPLDN